MSTLTVQKQKQQQQQRPQNPMIKNPILPKIPQNYLPIVHVLTSRTDNDDDEKKVEPFDFEKLIKFLLDTHTSHLIDRRIRFCHKLYLHHKNGYNIKDLHYLMRILNILADLCEEQPVYIEPFIELLRNCSIQFLVEKSTDAEIYSTVLVVFYTDFGYLLRLSNKRIQQSILDTLYKSIQSTTSSIDESDYDSPRSARIDYLLRAQCQSDLCETLVKAMALIENDVKLQISIIKLLQIYSSRSSDCIARMLTHDCINRLVARMNDHDPSGELLFRTVELLWNILEYGDEDQLIDQLNSRVTISLLQEAFLSQITQSYSQYHRQLRNDLLVVISLMITFKPDAPVVETGFAKQLLLFASYPELRSNNPLVKNFKLTTAQEDFEFKKLLINTVIILSRNPVMDELMINSRILLALLSYIEPLPRKKSPLGHTFEWTSSQLEELQLQALVALSILLPNSIDEYFEYHVGTRLLLYYEWTINDDEYKSQGNGFFGKGGRDNKKSQLRYILRLFRTLVSLKNERIYMDLADQGIISSITGYLKDMSKNKSNPMSYLDLDIVCDGLFILSCLGELDVHRKEIFGSDGIEILLEYLLIDSSYVCGGLGYHRLVVAVVDCAWCCVVGCVINEDEFIQKQGVFALLDLIETNPKSLQNIILGCLLDLIENSKCIHFILAWKGSKQQQFTHLLCDLWRDEEHEIHVSRTDKGAIGDPKNPLMGSLQQSVSITSLKSSEPSPAVLDLIDNMRSKIYGFFCKLGFNQIPGLHDEDFITLCIIENFLDFKLGEIWKEIMTELEIEGVKLITVDAEATDTILRVADERGLAVAATQEYVLDQYHKQDLQFEKAFYNDLIASHLFKEKRLEQWKSYVARTSKYPLLMAAKDSQNQSIRQSRPEEIGYTGYLTVHNLEIPNLSVTAFTGRCLQIESTPVDLLNKRR